MSLKCRHITPIWVATSILGGTLGAPFVSKATNSWYRRINLPQWLPPDAVFAPVWTVLYGLMGYSASRVFRSATSGGWSSGPIQMALFHYALNISWAPVFFGMKRLRVGHGINLALVGTLLAIIPQFFKVDRASGLLLLPYLAWLMFATALSGTICKLNPTEKGYNNAMLEADIYDLQKEAADKVGL